MNAADCQRFGCVNRTGSMWRPYCQRIGSLFSGIGGIELGLERAGVGHTVWQVEREPFCRAVLKKHWPDAQRFDDVRAVGAHNLSGVEVICGGFPCQDISFAGSGAGLAGERSGLWFEFARIVRELRPRFVVVENVAALLVRGLDSVLGTLAALGYDAEWSCIRASDVGAAHRRDRVFLLAWLADADGVRGERRGGSRLVAGAPSSRESDEQEEWQRLRGAADDCGSPVAHADSGRFEVHAELNSGAPQDSADRGPLWRHAGRRGDAATGTAAQPGVGGMPDGIRSWLDVARPGESQREWEPPRVADRTVEHRVARLKALGNAVVPQVAEVVGRRLIEIASSLERAA